MRSGEPASIERSASTRRLVTIGGAALMTVVSFGLIFVIFARLPYTLFALWLQMSHPWKVAAAVGYFFSLFSCAVWMRQTQPSRRLRANHH